MKESNNIKKNIVWNTIGVLTISSTSLLYTLILTHFCNLKDVGIFSFAFSFACMMITLASFGGRTIHITDSNNNNSNISYIITKYITVLITFLIVLIYITIKSYSITKTTLIIILCLFKFFEEISDVYYGVLQKENYLYKVGIFQTVKSIINIILFTLIIVFSKNIILSSSSILIVNILFALIIERHAAKTANNWKFEIKIKEIKNILYQNFYVCFFTFLTSYIISSPKYAIDKYLIDDMQAIFNIILMPATFIYLLAGFILSPFMVEISKEIEKKEYDKSKKRVIKIISIILLLGIIALIGCYYCGIPILNIIYGIDLTAYKFGFLIIILGSIMYSISVAISTILIAYRELKIQTIISLVLSILSYLICNILVKKLSITGGCYAYLIVVSLRALIYIILFLNVIKKRKRGNN
mgnify:FL=1